MVSQLDNNYKADDFNTGGTVNNAWNYAFIDVSLFVMFAAVLISNTDFLKFGI